VIAIPKRPPRKRLEADVMIDARAWLGTQTDVQMMRNNVGALKDDHGRLVTYGLGLGSCDLVGHIEVLVSATRLPAGEERYIARCFAIELKAPGKRPSPDQVAWMNVKRQQGWAIGWSDSLDGVIEIVEKARRWEI
jgi:hypothetical protein